MNSYSDFAINNVPFGIFSIKNGRKRLATIINDQVVDLYALAELVASPLLGQKLHSVV
jgi:hypothetical protein